MTRVRELIERVGPTDATVLLVGEERHGQRARCRSGAPAQQPRRAGRSLRSTAEQSRNCSSKRSSSVTKKGSFTGAIRTQSGFLERADGGTLFLDEITEMPIEMQVPLLRFLESRRYFKVGGRQEIAADVRVIAATNRVPHVRSANASYARTSTTGSRYFRSSCRRCVIGTRMRWHSRSISWRCSARPPARASGSRRTRAISRVATHWPGNVRELRHAIERSFILTDDTLELADALEWDSRRSQFAASNGGGNTLQVAIGSRLRDVEKSLIEATLEHFAGNKRHTADALGCSLKTLYNKLNTYSRLAREM
jgi:DNA-binding NtrC family response regulator